MLAPRSTATRNSTGWLGVWPNLLWLAILCIVFLRIGSQPLGSVNRIRTPLSRIIYSVARMNTHSSCRHLFPINRYYSPSILPWLLNLLQYRTLPAQDWLTIATIIPGNLWMPSLPKWMANYLCMYPEIIWGHCHLATIIAYAIFATAIATTTIACAILPSSPSSHHPQSCHHSPPLPHGLFTQNQICKPPLFVVACDHYRNIIGHRKSSGWANYLVKKMLCTMIRYPKICSNVTTNLPSLMPNLLPLRPTSSHHTSTINPATTPLHLVCCFHCCCSHRLTDFLK